MKNFIRLLTSFTALIFITACSVYSPSMLRASYANLSTEIAGYIKSTAELTDSQQAAVDAYASELMAWHRREQLPGYADRFSELAVLIERGEGVPLEKLQQFTAEVAAFPHFSEAGDITLKLASIAATLTDEQVAQIEQFADEENDDYRDEIMRQTFSDENDAIVDAVESLGKMLGVRLHKHQLTDVHTAVALRHDLREREMLAERAWNDELMILLEQRHEKSFAADFTRLWDMSDQLLTGVALEQKQQNKALMASMLQDILVSLDDKQKQNLVARLKSIAGEIRMMSLQSKT